MVTSIRSQALTALGCALTALVLCACEKPTVDVSLHGVNYSNEAFSYNVRDPAVPDDSGSGGELIDRFAAGGTTCCATLPRTWRPGIKLQVNTTHWLKQLPDGSLPEVKETRVVEVPPYVDGKPGELWVLRAADGSISVVSSDFQPDHPKWPGKVKGWPVPSLEYRRERWQLLKQHEEDVLSVFQSLLTKLEKTPEIRAKEAWEYAMKKNPSSLKKFSGPDDPHYLAALKEDYLDGLNDSREKLERLMESQP